MQMYACACEKQREKETKYARITEQNEQKQCLAGNSVHFYMYIN